MEIQSAFNAGVQGFQKAQQDANESASVIAREANYSAEQANQVSPINETAVKPSTSAENPPNLTQEVVNLKVAEYQAKASAEVIKTADDNLGTLLDVRV